MKNESSKNKLPRMLLKSFYKTDEWDKLLENYDKSKGIVDWNEWLKLMKTKKP